MKLVEKHAAEAAATEKKPSTKKATGTKGAGTKAGEKAGAKSSEKKPSATQKDAPPKVKKDVRAELPEAPTEVIVAVEHATAPAEQRPPTFGPGFESVLSRTRTALLTGVSATRTGAGQVYARVRSRVPSTVPQGEVATQVLPVESVISTPTAELRAWMQPAVEPERAPLAELDAREISAWFGDHQVLDRVSLTMPAGVITSLIGPSGCGKSTFLRILNRMHELIPAASLAGEVLLDGEDIYDAERRLVDARKSIGMVFQKPNPFPAMSIYDNVIAGLKLTGIRADRDHRDYLVESSLTKAGLWKEVRDRLRSPGGGLSGGQQQRLCIARSLAVAPRVLLMDEPCSALDPTSTRVIEETMLELAQEVTIVIVTHNMQQAQRVSTQCAFFLAAQGRPGGIVEHGSTEAMFNEPIDSRTFDYVNGRFG
jgi:phosphate transport system ATP-binding protein